MGFAEEMPVSHPEWKQYSMDVGLTGVVAVVIPPPPMSALVTRMRIVGSPEYTLDTRDPEHWQWMPVPGSEAVEGDTATGAVHQVATRIGYSPSDPTIEQFDPAVARVVMYVTLGK